MDVAVLVPLTVLADADAVPIAILSFSLSLVRCFLEAGAGVALLAATLVDLLGLGVACRLLLLVLVLIEVGTAVEFPCSRSCPCWLLASTVVAVAVGFLLGCFGNGLAKTPSSVLVFC